jgi:hypothetical protein
MKQRIGVIGVALLLGILTASAGCGNHANPPSNVGIKIANIPIIATSCRRQSARH